MEVDVVWGLWFALWALGFMLGPLLIVDRALDRETTGVQAIGYCLPLAALWTVLEQVPGRSPAAWATLAAASAYVVLVILLPWLEARRIGCELAGADVEACRAALGANESDGPAHLALGHALLTQGDLGAALSNYARALLLDGALAAELQEHLSSRPARQRRQVLARLPGLPRGPAGAAPRPRPLPGPRGTPACQGSGTPRQLLGYPSAQEQAVEEARAEHLADLRAYLRDRPHDCLSRIACAERLAEAGHQEEARAQLRIAGEGDPGSAEVAAALTRLGEAERGDPATTA